MRSRDDMKLQRTIDNNNHENDNGDDNDDDNDDENASSEQAEREENVVYYDSKLSRLATTTTTTTTTTTSTTDANVSISSASDVIGWTIVERKQRDDNAIDSIVAAEFADSSLSKIYR